MKFLLINVFFQYKTIAKVIPTDIFLNFHQQERAFSQIQTFSQKVYFETLFESFKMDKRNHEAMALSRCNTFASACRSTTSLSPNPLTPLHLASAHRKAMQDMYYNPNIEKSTSFDHLFNFKKTVLDFVVIAKRYPKRGIHKFELVSPSYCQRAGSGHREAMPAFKAQPDLSIAANSFALPPGPSPSISIHWIVPQSRAVASDMGSEQIFKKDFRFQVPTTQILRSAASPFQKSIYEIYQTYFLKCAYLYNQQSISIIINWILDSTTLLFFLFLLIFSTPQILILKTFFIESLLSLSETTKCFFLIFFLDLLVGFHSSKSWEIFLQFLVEHFGFQIHQNFIFFFISTFPVLLDTIFKYWIFRYLNKISPSTVATYQAMIE